MSMWVVVITGLICLIAGLAAGFFIARKTMMNYFKKNPPMNEQMIKMMMQQMGQAPSKKKINQMMAQMNKNIK